MVVLRRKKSSEEDTGSESDEEETEEESYQQTEDTSGQLSEATDTQMGYGGGYAGGTGEQNQQRSMEGSGMYQNEQLPGQSPEEEPMGLPSPTITGDSDMPPEDGDMPGEGEEEFPQPTSISQQAPEEETETEQEELNELFSSITKEEETQDGAGEIPSPTSVTETTESQQDERIGQTIQVACHNCGEMMEAEVDSIPMSIVCWNCGEEGLIE